MVTSSSTGAKGASCVNANACEASAQAGTVLKRTRYQVSAGAPVTAQTCGSSLFLSCEAQTTTLSPLRVTAASKEVGSPGRTAPLELAVTGGPPSRKRGSRFEARRCGHSDRAELPSLLPSGKSTA